MSIHRLTHSHYTITLIQTDNNSYLLKMKYFSQTGLTLQHQGVACSDMYTCKSVCKQHTDNRTYIRTCIILYCIIKMSVNTYRHPASLLDAAPGVEAGGLLTLAVSVSHNMPSQCMPRGSSSSQVTYYLYLDSRGGTNRHIVRITQLNYYRMFILEGLKF